MPFPGTIGREVAEAWFESAAVRLHSGDPVQSNEDQTLQEDHAGVSISAHAASCDEACGARPRDNAAPPPQCV